MKTFTKVCVALFIVMQIPVASIAQFFSAVYGYDANGNRTSASVTYLTLKSANVPIDSAEMQQILSKTDTSGIAVKGWERPTTDSLGNMKVSIYPNPTHGNILIEIEGATSDELHKSGNSIRVFDLEGKKIHMLKPVNYVNSLDLSVNSNGYYIISIDINGKVRDYTIIKN